MRVRKTGLPTHYVIPADPQRGQPKDKRVDYIGVFEVLRVDELVQWCKDNPDVPADTLAASLEKGAFR